MTFLFGTALFFVMICFVLGSFLSNQLKQKFSSDEGRTNNFLDLLSGFMVVTIICNTWSLFLPVNHFTLCFLFLLSLVLCINKATRISISLAFQKIKLLATFKMLAWTLPVILVWILFSVIAPQHGDSAGYHYASIRWIEEYGIVPGLANIQGRFGFNSAFFVTSAAFSIPQLAGQAIYPLNIAFSFAFFCWLINKIYRHKNTWQALVYAVVIVLMIRGFILTISSPTPDIIAMIIVFFVLADVGETLVRPLASHEGGISDRATIGYKISMSLLIVFAITIKLSCLFLLPVLLLFLLKHPLKEKRVWLAILTGSVFILAPWLARNYILSGYFIYPLAFTGFLQPDWQAPFAVLHFDKLLINNGPKLISSNWEEVNSMPFHSWFPLWVKGNFTNGLAASFCLLMVSIISLLTGIIATLHKKNYRLLYLLIVNLAAIGMWLATSPDYRFAYGYLIAGFVISVFYFANGLRTSSPVVIISMLVYLLGCIYYLHYGSRFLKGYTVAKYWFRPVPPAEINRHNDLSTFPFIEMAPDMKLYLEDSAHDCNNAPLPCFSVFFQKLKPKWIEARGDKIEDGFRMKEGVFEQK